MNNILTFKSTPAGETLEARVTKRNGQTATKNEPINRSKNNPSNKTPREIETVPCISPVRTGELPVDVAIGIMEGVEVRSHRCNQ